jgi:hypothetical protein
MSCRAGWRLLSLARQLPTDYFDVQADMFGQVCDLNKGYG